MKEKLKKDYPWLFFKMVPWVDTKRRRFSKVEFDPIIEDAGSHWRVYREVNSSPLILSKNY